MKHLLLGTALISAALVPAALPPGQAQAREPQPTRNEHINHLKQIGLAMHNYHSTFKKFPPAAVYDRDGKALLSWRVLILPYLEQNALQQQFKMDEPWDSQHNIKLLADMPKVFGPIGDSMDDRTKTYYRVFVGPGTVFEGKNGTKITSITDGTSNTIMVVEAHDGVAWTKPDELPYDPKGTLPRVGNHGGNGFHVLMCDGSVHTFRQNFDPQLMHWAITRDDGMPLDIEKLER